MYQSSTEAKPTSVPYQPVTSNGAPPASANYAFLANPPKHKHKPQPIAIRCAPARTLHRPASSRRRSSISGSPAFQTSFLALIDTPTPRSDISPKTPHLTTHGYTAAFATYTRRGSVPDVHPASYTRRVPISPKRASPIRSVPSSPKRSPTSGSPRRRQHRVPSPASPFAPPSPTRTRARSGSTTRIPVQASRTPPPPVPRTTKLSKIRSLTNLRARSPSPAPPSRASSPKPVVMTTPASTSKNTSKRAKRSATPARGSAAYNKYRPMPFIQQMQMIQFLEGGTLDSHIRRHHVHAGQGTAHTGFAIDGEQDIAHGYAFTDERGMIWFDEEEEWEFACLLPRMRPQRRRGIKRLLGKRRDDESEDEWEDFVEQEEEQAEEDIDANALLAREDDDLRARDDDLASFGGALAGAWARTRPGRSVLNLPDRRQERKRKSAQCVISSTTPPAPQRSVQNSHERTTALKQEFLATAFAPPPAWTSSPSSASPPLTRTTSPFRMFTRTTTTTSTDEGSSRTLFQRHRSARSVPNANLAATTGQSFASLGATMRGGDVLDAPPSTTVGVPQSPTVQWANMDDEPSYPRTSSLSVNSSRRGTPSPSPTPDMHLRSVSPPPAAARRLGIDPSCAVSLQPPPFVNPVKKQGFRSMRGFKTVKSN